MMGSGVEMIEYRTEECRIGNSRMSKENRKFDLDKRVIDFLAGIGRALDETDQLISFYPTWIKIAQ